MSGNITSSTWTDDEVLFDFAKEYVMIGHVIAAKIWFVLSI